MTEHLVLFATAQLPTEHGNFTIYVFREGNREHLALVKPWKKEPVLARIHSKCLTSESFGSLRCDCREQLETAAQKIGKETGIIVYLDQEGRDIGLGNKIRAYDLQDRGEDTVEANRLLGLPIDGRNYDPAVEILRHFKISSVKLLTNNPDKVAAVSAAGITVVQLKGASTPTAHNLSYLSTKLERLGHLGIMEMECIGNMRRANERPKESMTQRKEIIKRRFSPRITT